MSCVPLNRRLALLDGVSDLAFAVLSSLQQVGLVSACELALVCANRLDYMVRIILVAMLC
jgi:hypothetical protein